MKKIFLLLALVAGLSSLNAQSDMANDTSHRQYEQLEAAATIPRTIFVEGFGHAFNHLALHYEQRFKHQRSGWGWRVGLGYSLQPSYPVWSLPVGVNYLMGRKRNFLELGVGLTPWLLIGSERGNGYGIGHAQHIFTVTETTFRLLLNGTIGYRYQPLKSGINFGIGLSPIAYLTPNSLNIHPFWPYLRVGYTF